MTLTVRLDPETERALNVLAKRLRISRSEVVREALARYGATEGTDDASEGPYAAWHDVIGVAEVGARDPERTTGAQFAAALRERACARRSR